GGHGCFTYDVGTNVQLECFGDNGVHQALATTLACATPDYIQPPSGKHWADPEVTPQMLSVAGAHSCALSSSGELWCWGTNAHGELGSAVPAAGTGTGGPERVNPVTWAAVATGQDHSCAIPSDRASVQCWGQN